MKKLTVLCLTLCVMCLTGCSLNDEPVVITNEIPASLLEPVAAPVRPNVNTGDDTQDFKNGTRYVAELESVNSQNTDKILAIKSLVKENQE